MKRICHVNVLRIMTNDIHFPNTYYYAKHFILINETLIYNKSGFWHKSQINGLFTPFKNIYNQVYAHI